MEISRTDRSVFGQWWWTIDRGILGGIFLLILCGLMLVSSASPAVAERIGLPSFHFVSRHIIFLIPSLIAMIALSFMSPVVLRRLALLGFFGAMVLTFSTLFLGESIKGATRWLHFGSFSLQPSEFLKPSFALVCAWLLARPHQKTRFTGFYHASILLVLTIGLLLLQPDFGMSFVLASIWAAQIFLSGLPLFLIFALGVLSLIGIFGVYSFLPHVASRIDRFLNPASGDTYQVDKSLDSFSNGGLFGTGPAQGQIKLSLPDSHADFIFAVAGEEFGLIFTLFLIAIFVFILIRAGRKVMLNQDKFIILSVGGLLAQISIQALVHMGSSMQLLPAKGMTLPFISYGGSSLLALGITAGFLLAFTRKRPDDTLSYTKGRRGYV